MNRIICLIISLLILFELDCEVVGVPDYNYSVFPLEGWVFQPYENTDSLSWLSNDNSIAMSVTAYTGSTYDDIDYMFNNLSLEYNGSGNFVHFNYLNFQGAIGEILFDIGGKKFKGWVIFLNGEEFDYHLNAFTLEENFDNAFNEIQSVLDSFSYGEKGPLNPGPISSFLEESPQRQFKTFTVDFFNQKISVLASDYDLTSSQSLIEREADIMQNYSLDPSNFYNAWKRYYQIIFRDNYS
ncbi:MAG: hypothetical protein JXR64_02455, partial [Spirochaetales bacterium]|nr:hypothetical protein [Spirochaetales bacterium]